MTMQNKEYDKVLAELKIISKNIIPDKFSRGKMHEFVKEVSKSIELLEKQGWKFKEIEKLLEDLSDFNPVGFHIDYEYISFIRGLYDNNDNLKGNAHIIFS